VLTKNSGRRPAWPGANRLTATAAHTQFFTKSHCVCHFPGYGVRHSRLPYFERRRPFPPPESPYYNCWHNECRCSHRAQVSFSSMAFWLAKHRVFRMLLGYIVNHGPSWPTFNFSISGLGGQDCMAPWNERPATEYS